MATDDVNITEDAEMAEYEGDNVVTMMDVLQEQQEIEEDANAVLGASDDKNCTYSKGYIKRQAIYACLTCCPDVKTDPTKRAGVCLACSLMCHENHELIELYTKRNFRCDCGNPKFSSYPCQFTPNKPDLNNDNVYNQNFSGLYCICHRPYPDPEATTEEEMIQCIICEDWLHASHLDAVVPGSDQYSEMICKGCMDKNDFLHDYSNLAVNVESVNVDVLNVNGDKSPDIIYNGNITPVLSNNRIEDKTETITTITNGTDVDMSEDKKNNEEPKEIIENHDNASDNDRTKSAAELDNMGDESLIRNSHMKSHKTPESLLEEAKETNEETHRLNDSVPTEEESTDNKETEITKKDDFSSTEQTQNTHNDNMATEAEINTTSREPLSQQQVQKDELTTTNDMKNDEDKKEINADNSKTEDNSESNKTEDQLLDDIQALTSDHPSGDISKPDNIFTETVKSSENMDDNMNTQASNDEIKESTIDQASNDQSASTEINLVPKTSNVEVSGTSQVKGAEIETTDDKTDSVMAAIDELLKGPVETSKSDSKDNEVKVCENSGKTASSKENADNSEQIDTNVEINENKNSEFISGENQTSANLQSTTNPADLEKFDDTNNMKLSTSNVEANSDLNLHDDTNNSILDKEKEVNGDFSNENTALNETDPKNLEDSDINSISDVSHNKTKVLDTLQSETTNEHKRKLSTELLEETSLKKIKLDKCVRPKGVKKVYNGATFWPSNFRQKLCTCGECISMYKDLRVLFLTDLEDTAAAYKNLGKENTDGGASQYEKGLQALSSLDRIQQINALTEYNKMRDKLLDFLKSFKDRKEIVKEEDIKAFFAGMKPKREPDGVYFCR